MDDVTLGEVVRTMNRVRDDVAALRRDVVVRETYDAQRAALLADVDRIDRDLQDLADRRDQDQADAARRRWQVVLAVLTGSISLAVNLVQALVSLGGH